MEGNRSPTGGSGEVTAILFKGRFDPWHRSDKTGFSKTGYVTKTGVVIHPRRSWIARTPLAKIMRRSHHLIEIPSHPRAAQIETFFTQNAINNSLYVAGITAIGDATSHFWNHPIKIPLLTPISSEEHEGRWVRMLGVLQKGDAIFTLDTRSIISRIITYFDQGTWSHVATYSGDGQILEAIGSGVVERSIEAYHDPRYRLGVYRIPSATPEKIGSYVALMRSRVGDRYSYRKVLLVGIRLILGIWPTGAARHTTPNMLITRAGYDLIEIV
ncbi:MAG TPA: hypothetical protein VM755_22485 [Stellaceae bacterium]|nr:hypothetical protein [Stellaceae bacterium]